MTHYEIREDLSFCRIDGRPIFLDMRNDRYFCLSDELEIAFDAYTRHAESSRDVARLFEHNILTDTPPSSVTRRHSIATASRSALEPPAADNPKYVHLLPEVLLTVCWVQLQLKTRRLHTILQDSMARRPASSPSRHRNNERRLLACANAFLRTRKLLPVNTCCLLDSISLVKFLARRHLSANIVFGVTNDPFTAHCWVQSGDVVLNDAVGNIRAYSIIQVL